MRIRIVSSLTAEDEASVAQNVLGAISAMLDRLPIAYSLNIETTLGERYYSTRLTGDGIAALPRIPLPHIKLEASDANG